MDMPERIKQAEAIISFRMANYPCFFRGIPLINLSIFTLFLEIIGGNPSTDAIETWENYLSDGAEYPDKPPNPTAQASLDQEQDGPGAAG